MTNEQIQGVLLIVIGVPFGTVIICWIALMWTMHKTTGELKYWLTPDNVMKGVTIVFVVTTVLSLAVLGILEGNTVGVILSGIIGYTLGTKFPDGKM